MCLLSVFPSNIQPDLQELLNGIESNNDGVGFVIATATGALIVEHAIGIRRNVESEWLDKNNKLHTYNKVVIDPEPMEALARRFVKLRKRHPSGPAMFHSRLATGGVEDTRGCHPYFVNKRDGSTDKQTVLAHNGIMFSVPKGDWRSDTRIFAEDVLPERFNKFWRPAVRERLEKFLGNGNKIAIITTDKRRMTRKNGSLSKATSELFIFNEEMGYWTPEGAWHSNSGYKGFKTYRIGGYDYSGWENYSGTGWTGAGTASHYESGVGYVIGHPSKPDTGRSYEPQNECSYCHAIGGVDLYTEVCTYCNLCNGCGMPQAGCDCYTPRYTRQPANLPSVDVTRVLPALTSGKPAIESASKDEQRAAFIRQCWEEFENDADPALDNLTWEQYLMIREYEEQTGEEVMFDSAEQADEWLTEQQRREMAELAEDFAKSHETTDDPDYGEEDGIIRRLV